MQQREQPAKIAVSIREAYLMLSVGRSTLFKLIKEGKIPTRRLGGRVLIPVDGLRRFLDELPNIPLPSRPDDAITAPRRATRPSGA